MPKLAKATISKPVNVERVSYNLWHYLFAFWIGVSGSLQYGQRYVGRLSISLSQNHFKNQCIEYHLFSLSFN